MSDTIVRKLTSLLMTNDRLGRLFTLLGRKLLNANPLLRNKIIAAGRLVPDEDRSTAIIRDYVIYVNENIVGTKSVHTYTKRIINILKQAQIATGHEFLYRVLPGKNSYFHGPYASNAPHIVLANNEGYDISGLNLNAPPIDRVRNHYNHIPHNMHIILPPEENSETIHKMTLHIREPWDYAVLVLKALDYPIPHDTDSKICERAKIKCKLRNYNTRYNMARKLTSKNAKQTSQVAKDKQ